MDGHLSPYMASHSISVAVNLCVSFVLENVVDIE